jgi:predicted transcriptional regulator
LEASRKGELIDDEDVGMMIESWIRKKAAPAKVEREKV